MTVLEILNLAKQRRQAGQSAEAESLCRQALEQEPDNADALNLLGILLSHAGQHESALSLIGRAVSLQPDNAAFHCNLGLNLAYLGRAPQAVAEFRKSLLLDPLDHLTHYNLGNALRDLGRVNESIAAYEHALSLRPDHGLSFHNLASVLRGQERFDESIAVYRQALKAHPEDYSAHVNLGNTLTDLGLVDEAISCYERAEALAPRHASTSSRRLFAMHYQPQHDAQALLAEHRRWNQRYAQALTASASPHENDRSPDRRLRIGYLSPNFRGHVVGWNILPLLDNHDHKAFEIFCYSSVERPDELTRRLRGQADVWRDITTAEDGAAADLIRSDQIDILVDLSLHSGFDLLTFARKPAPVQVSYLGYAGTTGLDAIDYRLSDPFIDPPDSDLSCYSEQTIRLPRTYWCYQPGGPTPPVKPAPSAKSGRVTFGCLCAVCKVSDPALDAWGSILAAVPDSRLLLHCPPSSARQRLSARLVWHGLSADRLEFVPFQTWEAYMQTYHRMDIALDPFPYGGGITTCDALWMGVPVVSLIGRTAVGRAARSILANVGLAELAVPTLEDYRRTACDYEKLIQLRPTLRQRMLDSPLTDARQFARDVEAAYKQMWLAWRESNRK